MFELRESMEVLVGPKWQRAVILMIDEEGVHALSAEGEALQRPRESVAVFGAKAERGDVVLFERAGGWTRAKMLEQVRGRARVQVGEDSEWVELDALAVLCKPELADSKGASKSGRGSDSDSGSGSGSGTSEGESSGSRRERLLKTRFALLPLALAALAPLFGVLEGLGGWPSAAAWLALHLIIAAYAHAQSNPLPRFEIPGFGKPPDPGLGTHVPGFKLVRSPTRDRWELIVMLVGGWVCVGFGPIFPGYSQWVAPAYVLLVALAAVTSTLLFERNTVAECRRVLGAAPIRSAGHTGEGLIAGKIADAAAAGGEPALWREVLQYNWSVSREVMRPVTDTNGNTRQVQTTETSHYSCGLRRERERDALKIETSLGALTVSLRGAVWAAPCELDFNRWGAKHGAWRPKQPRNRALLDQTKTASFEALHAGDAVVVLGELRLTGEASVRGGEQGPLVLYGSAQTDPRAVLAAAMLRRRVLITVMVVLGFGLGLGTLASALM